MAAKGGQSYLKSIANEALSDDFFQKSINGEALNNDVKKGMLLKHYMLTTLTCVGGVGQKWMSGVGRGAEQGCEMGQLILSMDQYSMKFTSLRRGLLPKISNV